MERFAARCQAPARLAESASPQNKLRRKVGKLPSSSRPTLEENIATDGTENHTVKFFSLISVAGTRVSPEKGHRVAPPPQQANRSCTLQSNVRSKCWEQRSSSLIPYLSPTYCI